MVRLRCDVFACLPLLTLGACVFMYMCARSHTSVHSYGVVHACMHVYRHEARTRQGTAAVGVCSGRHPRGCVFVCFASRML